MPVTSQVPLPLVPDAQARFDNYLPGPNGAALTLLCTELPPRAPHYLWGPSGSGKTHLLQAAALACSERGLPALACSTSVALPWEFPAGCQLLIFDDVHQLSPEQQQAAFALCLEAQAHGVAWLSAAPMPPVDLPLRDDLRTRLAWGQVHALQPLNEEETLDALGSEAQRRGILLSPEVKSYLFSRFSRDLGTLMRLLDHLDVYSLSRGRAVTVPLLKRMVEESGAAAEPAATLERDA